MSCEDSPYDNAPMECFYNTFKNEYICRYYFKNDDELNLGTKDYVFVWYNYVRSHSYNGGYHSRGQDLDSKLTKGVTNLVHHYKKADHTK